MKKKTKKIGQEKNKEKDKKNWLGKKTKKKTKNLARKKKTKKLGQEIYKEQGCYQTPGLRT